MPQPIVPPLRHLRRAAAGVVTIAVLVVSAPPGAAAQTRLVVGGQAGWVSSRQLVRNDDPSGDRDGFLAGAFLEVGTPKPWLGALAEASFVQRGGRFELAGGQDGDVRADYLVFTIAPVFRRDLGPVSLFTYGGPALETYLQARAAAELQGAYREPSDQIFSVVIGGGIETPVGDAWTVRLEARHVEGLSSAFDSTAGEFRHRSREILVRVGRVRGR